MVTGRELQPRRMRTLQNDMIRSSLLVTGRELQPRRMITLQNDMIRSSVLVTGRELLGPVELEHCRMVMLRSSFLDSEDS